MAVLPFTSETRITDSGRGFCGSCGCELSSTETVRCTACKSANRQTWRHGQVVVLAESQIAFVVRQRGRGEEYPGCFDVLWVDCIGAVISMPYDARALYSHGNAPGVNRVLASRTAERYLYPTAGTR